MLLVVACCQRLLKKGAKTKDEGLLTAFKGLKAFTRLFEGLKKASERSFHGL
jgi:hypothetical protein